ncbi:MAG: VWA domain-containing protein [Pirellulales bacterium]|nr:VWA domain-containing protein [Pirellulales bacterium]
MKRHVAKQVVGLLIVSVGLLGTSGARAEESAKKVEGPKKGPRIEIAFVLDTTGSMSGLIAGAKEKIWSIANQISSGKPRPDVFMALVPYRDKGDSYVTKVFQLTSNLDQVHTDLMKFQAQGGGDGPENVNQGLYDAIHKLQWSEGKKVTRIIYLVGDFPPHNEYKDVPTYDKLAKAAIEKGIYVNTILCGNNNEARVVWQEIARRAEGEFFQIAQDGAVRSVDTPYDRKLAELNRELLKTAVVYGEKATRETQTKLNADASAPVAEPESAEGKRELRKAADRVEFSLKAGKASSNDLISDLDNNKVKLDNVPVDQLPETMQKMTPAERKTYVANQQAARAKLAAQIKDLSSKRDEHLKKEAAASPSPSASFDLKVMESAKKQAAKAGVEYGK